MDKKDKMWSHLRPANWRTLGPFSNEEEIDRKVREEGPGAFLYLKEIVENNEEDSERRYRAMQWLVSLCNEPVFGKLPKDTGSDKIAIVEALEKVIFSNLDSDRSQPRKDALTALALIVKPHSKSEHSTKSIDILLQLANDNKLRREARIDVLSALSDTKSPKAIEPLALGVLEGMGGKVIKGVQEISSLSWEDKAKIYIELIKKNPIRSRDIDADGVILSLSPLTDATRRDSEDLPRRLIMIGNFLIEQSRNQDERIAGILAKLLIESVGGDQNQAGYRIQEYQRDHKIPTNELDRLYKSIGHDGGDVMGLLQRDLETYFKQPIYTLNESTRTSWDNAVKSAQNGLRMRLWMSGTVFVVGIVLLLASGLRILFFKTSANGFDLSTLIPFFSGLGTILLIIYTGPLKEIRQAVTDLATASAAFIAYVHRVLETSHTFSFYYLNQNISFEELQKSNAIIQDAMINTINALDRDARNSSEKIINEAISRITKSLNRTAG